MKLSSTPRLWLLTLIGFVFFTVNTVSAQVSADIQAVETLPGVFTFSTSYAGGTNPIYVWSFGDGNQATGNPVDHAYSFGGNYQVYLQVYDSTTGLLAAGDTLLNVFSVTCDITPNFTFNVMANGVVIFDQFSSSVSGNINHLHWDLGDGNVLDDSTAFTHTYTVNGVYTVCLTVQDDLGCTDTVCLSVPITNACNIQTNIAYSVDTNTNTASFVSTVVNATFPVAYSWSFPGATPPSTTISNPLVTYPSSGIYGACLTVSDANGCVATACDSVIIGSGCGLTPIFTSQVDPNGIAILAGTVSTGTAPFTFYWDLGDGATATGQTITHQYTNSGVYTVCLIVIDGNGCTAMSCNPVTVSIGGCPSQLVNLATTTGAAGFVSFNLTPIAGSMPFAVYGDYGDGSPVTGPYNITSALFLSYTYGTPGMYTACFYVTDAAGCTDTICQDVNTNCPTMAATFVTINLTGGLVELTAVATGGTGPYTYTWSPNIALSATTGATVISSTTTGMNYCVTAVDINGCIASYCGPVNPPCTIEAEFTYTLSGNNGIASIDAPVAGGEYIWIINGSTYIGATVNFYLNAPGSYSACVNASIGNCFDQFCDTVEFAIPNADTVSGFVWDDANGNGFWDAGEEPMEQALVVLCQPNDTNSCQYAYTDVNGQYVFIVAPDTYEISAINWWSTYVQTFPVSPTTYTVTTTGNTNLSGFDFGFQDQGVTITGCVFYDTNNNGTQDLGETGAAYQYVMIEGWWYYTNADGCYSVSLVPGTYVIDFTPPVGAMYTLSTVGSYTVNASTAGQTYGPYSFGLYADPTLQNLCVNITPWTTVTPGFPAWYYITYCNYGATPASGTVTFTWDPILTPTNLDPAPTTQTGNTATWDFSNLAPGMCQTIYADFSAPTTLPLGTLVTNGVVITPIAGDNYPANNTDTTHQTTVGSWDPNAKEVMPVGSGSNGAIDQDNISKLTYTVHFQNTGSAPAVNVVLIDTLSSNVDYSTFKMNAASHDYTLDFNTSTGVAQWTFNNIMLPDSGADYQGSMGFVEFEIDLVDNLNEGTEIENFADIYFDFNEPVRTNTVVNTIEDELSVNALVENVSIGVMPNPASEYLHFVVTGLHQADYKVIVRNVLGQKVTELSSNGQKATMQRQGLSSGIYSFEISSNLTILGTGTFVLD